METVPAQVNTGNNDMCMQNNEEANVTVSVLFNISLLSQCGRCLR